MARISKNVSQNILLLVLSVLISVIFAEIALRIVLPAPIVWKYPQEYYLYDKDIGHWLKPNQHAYTHDKIVSTNSVGIRDLEYSKNVHPNVYRILALGDSQTFGNGLELADTWPKQLEALLNQSGNEMHVEVLNCGLPGSDTWQHELIQKRMLNQYKADAIVLAFYVNDVVKRFTPKPRQNEVTNTLVKRVGYILKQSALLLTLRAARDSIAQRLSASNLFLQKSPPNNGEFELVLEDGWNQVEKSLSKMKKMNDKANVMFIVASLPRRDQVDGRLSRDVYNERLTTIVQKYQIPMIDMLQPLKQAYVKHGKDLFIPWDGHNSRIANYVIAQEIAKIMFVAIDSDIYHAGQ